MLGGIGSAFGLLAAGLWLWASVVKVKPRPQLDADGWQASEIEHDGGDVVATMAKQSRINAWAAGAASLSALCQVLAPWLDKVG